MSKLRILDIGAANFKIDDRWINLNHIIEPILFEPDPRSYKRLKESGFEVYNSALGNEEGIKTLNLTQKPACSSFLEPNMAYLSNFPDSERWHIVDRIGVNSKKLDSFDLNVDFIKIDTQGTELEILKGGVKTLRKVLGLELEVSFIDIYKNQPLFGDVCSFLSEYGFEFYDFAVEYRYGRMDLNRKGQLAFADALFLRNPENLLETNRNKISVYKTIAKAYGKEDLIQFLNSKEL